MKLFARVAGLAPATLRALLDAHERVLSAADTADSVVLASQLGLWLPTEGESWRRVGWDEVVKATWTDSGLEVIQGSCDADGLVSDLPAESVVLTEARDLPAVVRQRVEASIARWEQVRVPGGTARLVARRVPGADGLRWTGRLDTGAADTQAARDVVIVRLREIALDAARVQQL